MPSRDVDMPPEVLVTTSVGPPPDQYPHIHVEKTFEFRQPGYNLWREFADPIREAKRSKSWNSFQHHKLISNSGGGQTVVLAVDAGDSNYTLDSLKYEGPYVSSDGIPGPLGEFTNGLPEFINSTQDIIIPVEIEPMIAMAYKAMLPYVRSELSLINSVIELKDFRSLYRRVKDVYNIGIRLLPKYLEVLSKNKKTNTLRQLARWATGDYLQWQFALSPFISDVVGLYRAMSQLERRLNDLVSRSGGTRVSHFTREIQVDPAVVTDEYERNAGKTYEVRSDGYRLERSINATYYHYRTVWNDPVRFHAQLKYNYHYAQYQVEHARLLGTLDALGLNLNPAIIWNALPWSFVVDWFIGIGRWLDSTKIGGMDPKINVQDFLWSIRRSRRIQIRTLVRNRRYYSGLVRPDTYVGGNVTRPLVSEVAYSRNVSTPTWNSLTTSGFSPKELSLGAALVLVRGRRFSSSRKLRVKR